MSYKEKVKNLENRSEKEIKCYELLDSLGVEYRQIDHPPAMTMQACEEVDRQLNIRICKNLFLCNRQKTAFYLLVMPGDKLFRTKDLSAQINSARLSFASGEDMERYIGTAPGSASILGLMNDSENAVRLLVDIEIKDREYFGCHPCFNTSSLRFRTADLFEKVIPALSHKPTIVCL